jgi:hypothetical protein
MRLQLLIYCVCLTFVSVIDTNAEELTLETVTPPAANTLEEPLAESFSMESAARFLDRASLDWTKSRKCFTCHTNYSYLIARPAISAKGTAHRQIRQALEDLVESRWVEQGPRWDAEVVMSAAVLALNDAATTGTLHPTTRKALDRMWTVQQEDGGIDWLKCGWPPMESDDDFGACMLALAAGAAPENYRKTQQAQAGLARLRDYLSKHPAPTLHHEAMLLWADSYLGDLLTKAEREATVQKLLGLQKEDGGWNLASLGNWERSDDKQQDLTSSDGYATGFVVYILHRSGIASDHPKIQKGINWLKSNQRESGRWFTRSLNKDNKHFISHAGTAFAVMAIAESEQPVAVKEATGLKVGVAETDITPPNGFPMAGYYHERLAEGTIDPLKAKAIVFRSGETSAALVVCDLIGIATDLSREIRKRATARTGIPESNIVVSATHSHTAPDYMKELYLYLGEEEQQPLRAEYIKKLIAGPVDAIARADAGVSPSSLKSGSIEQTTEVSFNRRFVMRDGSVRTWQNYRNPEVVRAAGPIDPAIELLMITSEDEGAPKGFLSNFALHLDTVGGTKWSADYPYFIEKTLRNEFDPQVISIFGTGCCGDINHSDPSRKQRNKVDFIGNSLGNSITQHLGELQSVDSAELFVASERVELPLQEAPRAEVERSVELLKLANAGEKIDFFEHVTAYKTLILDQLRHKEPYANSVENITWGLSRSLAGIGERLPVDVTVMTIGNDLAIVCLPGEVFVELGLAIKQASPFRTTMIIELSNSVETIYIPHRAAYAGGSYEVTNSALQPGSGEMLVETALRLLRQAASHSAEVTR